MQRVLLDETDLDGVEEGDEGFGGVDNERGISKVALLACSTRRALLDCDGDTYAQSFGCSWAVKLSTMLACK